MSASSCRALSLAQRDEELHDLNLHGAGAAPELAGLPCEEAELSFA
jgi:hypothetical protein